MSVSGLSRRVSYTEYFTGEEALLLKPKRTTRIAREFFRGNK
jgi:hypothetical protein